MPNQPMQKPRLKPATVSSGLSCPWLSFLATPVSDAKVLTGRQKPLTEVAIIIAEIRSRDGFEGVGFSYSKRAGGGESMLMPKKLPITC